MERQNAKHDKAIEVNLNQAELDLDDDDYGALLESDFELLYDGGNDIDWSEGYDKKYETWLDDYCGMRNYTICNQTSSTL